MSFVARRSTAFKGEIFTPRVLGRNNQKNSMFTPMTSKYQSSGSNLIDFSDYLHADKNIEEISKNETVDVRNSIKQRISKFIDITESGKTVVPRKKFALEEINQDQLLEVKIKICLF